MTVLLSYPLSWFHNVASILRIHGRTRSLEGKIAEGAISFNGREVFGIEAEYLEEDNMAWGPTSFRSKNRVT